jgi:transcriptional regulator with XRE-family HTH domain
MSVKGEFFGAMLTRVQIRMARAALGWGVRDLADRAGLAPNTVSRFENGADARVDTLAQMQEVLERAGIIFLPADETGGPGVRLRAHPSKFSRL